MSFFRPEYIVIHHTVTPFGSGQQVADLKHYHVVLDYNPQDNTVRIYQSIPDNEQSFSGTGYFNSKSYAVALVGNFERYSVPPELLRQLVQCLVIKCRKIGILNPDKIVSHNFVGRFLAARKYITACPGHYMLACLPHIRSEVARRLKT